MIKIAPTVNSPCVRSCTLNEKEVCLGCGRSLSEILNWHNLNYEEKSKILEKIAKERALTKADTKADKKNALYLK